MNDERAEAEPSSVRKLLYLGGIRAPSQHEHWVAGVIHDTGARHRGALLAIPNVAIMAAFGVLSLAIGDPTFAIFLFCGAAAVGVAGFASKSIESRRVRWLAKRNNINATPR